MSENISADFRCPYCPKVLPTNQGLKAHIKQRRSCRLADDAAKAARVAQAAENGAPHPLPPIPSTAAADPELDAAAESFFEPPIDPPRMSDHLMDIDDLPPPASGHGHRVTVEDEEEPLKTMGRSLRKSALLRSLSPVMVIALSACPSPLSYLFRL